jgi:hypothetical protein
MKDFLAFVALCAFGLLALTGLSYYGLQMAGYFQPKYEQVRRNVFMESQAYNDGMMRDLQNLQLEYQRTDDAGKAIIRSAVLHRLAAYDPNRLPADLRDFYFQLKTGN